MYSTDLTDAQWNNIKNSLDNDSRKRKSSLRSVWNALMYVVKTGCQWRMLPKDFPQWQLVYYYYRKWINLGLFDIILDKLRAKVRLRTHQNSKPTLGIMDSQTVRWGNNRSLSGYDGNKKVKGIKRHVVVDKNGFLLAIMVTVASVYDGKAVYMLMRVLKDSYANIKTIIADGGYRGDVVKLVKKKFDYLIQAVVKKREASDVFELALKRWVVERTFAWFENDRRLCRHYELLMESAEEMVKLSAIKLLLNKF